MNKIYNPVDDGKGFGGAEYPGYTYPIWTRDRLAGHIRTNRIFYPTTQTNMKKLLKLMDDYAAGTGLDDYSMLQLLTSLYMFICRETNLYEILDHGSWVEGDFLLINGVPCGIPGSTKVKRLMKNLKLIIEKIESYGGIIAESDKELIDFIENPGRCYHDRE
jgi:hypothetical protein